MGHLLFSAFHRSMFIDWVKEWGLRLLLSLAAILVCTPADRKASAWNILFVCASIVHFSRTG